MAVAASFSGDWQTSLGNRRGVSATLTFSATYTTGGETLTPAMLGLGAIDVGSVLINQGEDGYVFKYDYANQKVLVYRSGGFTPAGTLSTSAVTGTAAAQVFTGDALAGHTHTFTGDALASHTHDMKIIGGQGAAATDTVTAPAATDILGKQEAGDADILGVDVATKGGVVGAGAGTPAGTNDSISGGTPSGTNAESAITGTAAAQTFTGDAVAAGPLVELANGASLTNIVTQLFASGV